MEQPRKTTFRLVETRPTELKPEPKPEPERTAPEAGDLYFSAFGPDPSWPRQSDCEED